MHEIKRAIIMAAGRGERLSPLTDRTPKPLIRVQGIRMIDSVIRALHENEIREIYVVVGYLQEAFLTLPAQYPGLHLIENPDYDCCNNISSLYAARDYLSDCMILDGDQIIRNPAVCGRFFERSGYQAVWTEDATTEWLMQTDEDGWVTKCSRTGGERGWQLYSVSRWSEKDGAALKECLQKVYREEKKTNLYWDDVAMFCYPERFHLGVFPMQKDDVVEIDSLEELCQADPSYR